MIRDISNFKRHTYDVLVIGGGINGAAIAHMAALNGLKVALLEKDDFASGTSSKSTKLLHGGIRYLENFEFDLVHEALLERHIHLESSPHLVKALGFVVPVYKSDARPLWMMKIGVWLYDLLSGKYAVNKHCTLSTEEILKFIPTLKAQNLQGGVLYYDAQMDDARMCLENVLSAQQYGADVANYVEVKSLIQENGVAVGVIAQDLIHKDIFEIRAKKIICTVGPWANQFLEKDRTATRLPKVRTTKGIHIVYRGKLSEHALLVMARDQKRIFFIIPWKNHSLIGTTDTDFTGTPDSVKVEENDIQYLFEQAQRVFEKVVFKRENIIATFAGLRPLVHQPGAPGNVSRKHVIKQSPSGIVYVMGGKYTTYRKIAEQTLRKIHSKKLIPTDQHFPLYGSGVIKDDILEIAQQYQVEAPLVRYLIDLYGTRYKDVLNLTVSDPFLKEPICSCSPTIRAQVIYSLQIEMAHKEEDIIWRRLNLAFTDCPTKNCRKEIQTHLKM